MNEIERIKFDYKQKEENRSKIWTYFNPVNVYLVQEREKEILYAIDKIGKTNLSELKILDIGCGYGSEIAKFILYGSNPKNLYGIDIIEERINKAVENFPSISFYNQDASNLNFKDDFFDIIIQMTAFSSITDSNLKNKIAKEIERVLKKDGILIWYDIKPISKFEKKLNRLFEIIVIFKEKPSYFFSKLISKLKRNVEKDSIENSNTSSIRINLKEISKQEVKGMFNNINIIYSKRLGILYHILNLFINSRLIIFFINKLPFFKTHELLVLRK